MSLDRFSLLSVRRVLFWIATEFRMLAIVPLVLVCVYWFSGERALIVTAAALPVFALACHATMARTTMAIRGSSNDVGTSSDAKAWLENQVLSGGQNDFGVIAVSIDNLDALEDRVGDAMQEIITGELSLRLRRLIRSDDVIAVGDGCDFLICVGDVRPPETENLLLLAQRLQETLDDPFHYATIRTYCTISLGIVRSRQLSSPKPDAMVSSALIALAEAKATGPGTVRVFKSSTGAAPASHGDLNSQVAASLENGEIVGWYQPQLSTDTGKVSGFEALARWEHPSRGLISPATFLGIIEKAGLSQRLAEVVLTHALTALRTWDRAGFDIPSVAVNFATEELRNPRLSEYIRWELDRHDIAPNRLSIEVLENVIAERHDDIVARNLRNLADIGCRIEMDDFGTGYTSILNIRKFSVSRIKIDRRLGSRIDQDADQRDLVASLLALSERLGIETLGEGVETPDEHAMLGQMGCNYVQGFAIARPMPLGDTLTWVAAHNAELEKKQPQMPISPKGSGVVRR